MALHLSLRLVPLAALLLLPAAQLRPSAYGLWPDTSAELRPSQPSSISLDHVVLAVNDLEATAARYRRLGFALKPGRPHENGIRNEHVKFRDGTEIELLTAPEAKDGMTTRYRQHLAEGDGPAYLALFPRPAPPKPEATPSYVFYGQGNRSPTDRPEHFAHANTAYTLTAVWLAAADLSQERALLQEYGAPSRPGKLEALAADAQVASVMDGAIYLLPERFRVHPRRPVVGASVAIRDRQAAARVLTTSGVPFRTIQNSILLAPPETNGLWIELRESRAK